MEAILRAVAGGMVGAMMIVVMVVVMRFDSHCSGEVYVVPVLGGGLSLSCFVGLDSRGLDKLVAWFGVPRGCI